jgi:hypothetical protein
VSRKYDKLILACTISYFYKMSVKSFTNYALIKAFHAIFITICYAFFDLGYKVSTDYK